MVKNLTKKLCILISFILIFQLVGCGTILYPERKGQREGRIDPAIAILDAVGLLFGIIPGVIAFGFDFNNGTIYLPGTSTSSLDMGDIRQVKFDPKGGMASVKSIIERETGCGVELDWNNMIVYELKSTDEMMTYFAQALPEIENARTAVPGMN